MGGGGVTVDFKGDTCVAYGSTQGTFSVRDELAQILGMRPDQIEGSIVSCVVPQLTPEYAGMCDRYLQGGCLIVAPGVKTGMPILLDNPVELGADRLVNAVAAVSRSASFAAASTAP